MQKRQLEYEHIEHVIFGALLLELSKIEKVRSFVDCALEKVNLVQFRIGPAEAESETKVSSWALC